MHVGTGLGSGELQDRNQSDREQTLIIETAKRTAERREAAERLAVVYDYVSSCTEVWVRINKVRTAAKLEPLALTQICVALPSMGSDVIANVLVEDAVDALLSKDALNQHEKFLQYCTTLQIKEVSAKSNSGPPPIANVCPLLK